MYSLGEFKEFMGIIIDTEKGRALSTSEKAALSQNQINSISSLNEPPKANNNKYVDIWENPGLMSDYEKIARGISITTNPHSPIPGEPLPPSLIKGTPPSFQGGARGDSGFTDRALSDQTAPDATGGGILNNIVFGLKFKLWLLIFAAYFLYKRA